MRRDPFRTTYIRNPLLRALWYPLESIPGVMKVWPVVVVAILLVLCAFEVVLHVVDPKTAFGIDAVFLAAWALKWASDKFRGRGRNSGPWNPPGESPPASPVTAGPQVPAGTAGGAAKMVD